MAADKYLALNGTTGLLTSTSASVTSTANAIVALDAGGLLDVSVMPGALIDTLSIATSEALSAGDFVQIYDATGTPTARKADATSATFKEAMGFVIAGSTSPGPATVYFSGPLTLTGTFTAGQALFLSTTPGGVTTTEPSGGDYSQFLGFARADASAAPCVVGIRMDRAVKT
jgi:hypothetical protein